MVVFLGLISAVLFGAADFSGGMASKRCSVLQVVAVSHLIGLVGIGITAVVIANPVRQADLVLGSVGGLAGLVGVALLYRLLAVGPMGVVAPLTALTSAALPAMWGFADGERFSTRGWIGIALALCAVGLASSEIGSANDDSKDSASPVTIRVVAESLLSGAGFGIFFIVLDATSASSAPWALVAARITTTVLLFLILIFLHRRVRRLAGPQSQYHKADSGVPAPTSGVVPSLSIGGWSLLAGAGIADTGANLTFLYGTQLGDLTLVSVMASLYPIVTVALARIFVGEKMGPVRVAALLIAVVAAQLLSTG